MQKTVKRKKLISIILAWTFVFGVISVNAQTERTPYVQILIQPDHSSWIYQTEEEAFAKVSVLKNNIALEEVELTYKIGPELMPADMEGNMTTHQGEALIDLGSSPSPGFRQCIVSAKVDGRTYSNMVTVGFSPEKIKPSVEDPEDFDKYWGGAIAKMKESGTKVNITTMPEHSSSEVDVSLLYFSNPSSGISFYGYLSKPKKEGKYPVLLYAPGAGITKFNPFTTFAKEGIITLFIEIHGISPMVESNDYLEIRRAFNDYMYHGVNDRDTYYYKKVYLGCVAAVDYLCELPDFDGKNVAVFGGSQGGALSIVTAALNKKVTCLAAFHPALSDMTGYLHGRAGGWPHIFSSKYKGIMDTRQIITTLSYYDVVNFAKRLTVPGFYSFGYNDQTCCPTSGYSVINSIKAPQTVWLTPNTGHWRSPELVPNALSWLEKIFNNQMIEG